MKKQYLYAYLCTLVIILVVDFVWIGLIMGGFYHAQLWYLMGKGIVWWAALLFYLLYVVGIFYFAVLPALSKKSIRHAGMLGLFLGLIAYGTYDLSNQATLREWPVIVTIVDMVWGSILTGFIAMVGFRFVRFFSKKHHG